MATALSAENISKSFGNLAVLQSISFAVEEGEAIVLLGPSGCGKTTLLKLIAGFLSPDSGKIVIANRVVSTPIEMIPTDQRKMSMVFQSYAIWPHKSVFQNVAYGLEVKGLRRTEIKRRVMDALAVVRLEGLEHRYSTELSGGQQQRVALARAIVVEPSLLLLDEPLSNLDSNLRVEMREELKELHQRIGISFIYVTHDQSEAMVLGDRILLMNKGQLVQQGSPEALYEKPANAFAAKFIGSSNVFRGKRTGRSNGTLEIETGFGVVRVGQQVNVAENSAEVSFCIRPEWIQMFETAPSGQPNLFSGKVLKRVYCGRHVHYVVGLAGADAEVDIETPFDVHVPPGADVTLALPPERCVCLALD